MELLTELKKHDSVRNIWGAIAPHGNAFLQFREEAYR